MSTSGIVGFTACLETDLVRPLGLWDSYLKGTKLLPSIQSGNEVRVEGSLEIEVVDTEI